MNDILKAFVEASLDELGLKIDVADVIRIIKNEARKKASNGCAVLSDDEVYHIITESPALLEEEKKNKTVETPKENKAKNVIAKAKAKKQKKETKVEQYELDLFDDEEEEIEFECDVD